ncbi:MAG TPA: class I SAM-dependent methyltransferase [Gaiellaceae bacterium]|nr:class I SAM-dependent methyltransferase [Gaiellaceae bacterium]
MSRTATRVGLDLVRHDYHSPIPDLERLPSRHFTDPHPMPGVAWDLDAQLAFLEQELGEHLAEFPYPRRASSGFYLDNDGYESVDAETLWAMVRHLEPSRIVELGSGFTTLLLAGALEANGREGHTAELRVFDPYPLPLLDAAPRELVELAPVSAQDVPLDRFLALGEGDVLFVDTTHTVKAGSEVNRVVLDILPRLAPGVVVHFHDIFLPYEYPERWLKEQRFFWAEQYLLQAFLACNDSFEVLLAANALAQAHPDRVSALIQSFQPGVQPGAFWIRRL